MHNTPHTEEAKIAMSEAATKSNDARYKLFIEKWKLGDENGMRGKICLTSRHIHRYLREKYGDKCMECGWAKINVFTNKVPLDLEHIDGNSRNNKEDNLKLLCPNCHSLTATYKGANKGNGRDARYRTLSEWPKEIV